MPNVVIRYPGRRTAVRNSKVAIVQILRQPCRILGLPSRTTLRKISSIGASIGSNRSIVAPARTSVASASDGALPSASISRHDPPHHRSRSRLRGLPAADRA